MSEFKMEMPKTPESDWLKVLEAVSKQGFAIQTSTPRDVPEGNRGGSRVLTFAQNESKGIHDDSDEGKSSIDEAIRYYYDNKEIFKRASEVLVFTPNNKLVYMVNPNDATMELVKKALRGKSIYDLPPEEQVPWLMAFWTDIHSFPPRGGNLIRLVMDFEPGLQKQFEANISKDPAKVRELLEKIVKERMLLGDYWREQNPDTLTVEDFPKHATSWKEYPSSSIRPPWEFLEKLGLNEMYIQYSDSTKEQPHSEYRKIETGSYRSVTS